nr:unnamed protein product [Spirometra erinaceieuropaei]
MVPLLHDGMTPHVTDNAVDSGTFEVTNEIQQGFVFTSTLSSPVFSVMLMDTYCDERPPIHAICWTDGQLLNRWRMHFESHMSATFIHRLLFADDCDLNAISEGHMQRHMNLFVVAYDNLGLVITRDKTVFVHQPSPNAEYNNSQILVNGNQIQTLDSVVCLRNTISCCANIGDKVGRRLSKVIQAFGQLQAPELNRHGPQINTKLKLRKLVVLMTLLRQLGRVWRYKDGLNNSTKHLQINPTNWKDLVLDRPTWRRAVKTGAATHEANRIIAVKVKRDVRKSQIARPRNANSQPPLTCPRCRRTFRAQLRPIGHLSTDCGTLTALPDAPVHHCLASHADNQH